MPSGGGTTSGKTGLPGRLQQPIMSGLEGLLGGGEGRPAALSRFMFDPQRFAQIGSTIGESAFGQNLDASQTPAGKGLISAINQQSQQGLAESLAPIRSRFALSGQNLSGPLLSAETQAATQAGKNRDAIVSEALFNTYNQERGRQLASLGALGQFEQTPLNIVAQLAPLFSKQSSTVQRSNPLFNFIGK
jgi:hypothetical protein